MGHHDPQLTPADDAPLLPSDSDNNDGHRSPTFGGQTRELRTGWLGVLGRRGGGPAWNPSPLLTDLHFLRFPRGEGACPKLLLFHSPSPAPCQGRHRRKPDSLSSHSRACTSHSTPCCGQEDRHHLQSVPGQEVGAQESS